MAMFIEIDGRRIGRDYKPYIIAELSANHGGDLQCALESIAVAKECGADAVKIQTYVPDAMTIQCDREDFYVRDGLWKGKSLYELYEWAHTPYEWHDELFEFARKNGITIFSSPFDEIGCDLLERLNAPAYKVASFEATDIPLIRHISGKDRPVILSTGMANLDEITEAVSCIENNKGNSMAILHCISGYPTPIDQSNLRTMVDLGERFGKVFGLSDHTIGSDVAVAAVALGASIIEKHFTLSRSDKSPDSEFSMEPDELKELCLRTEVVWQSLGKVSYERKKAEEYNLRFRRSLYAVEDISAGEEFSLENIRRIRPGFGIPPKYQDELIGKTAKRDIARGDPILWEDL